MRIGKCYTIFVKDLCILMYWCPEVILEPLAMDAE